MPRPLLIRSLTRSYLLGLSLVVVVVLLTATLIVAVARGHISERLLPWIAAGFCILLLAVLAFETFVVFLPGTRAIAALLHEQESKKDALAVRAEEMRIAAIAQSVQNETLQSHQQILLEQQDTLMAQQDELLAQKTTLTEQRDHLEQRATELSRLTAILDATPDAVAVFALTGELLYGNAAADGLLQYVRKRDWTHAAHLLTRDSLRQLRDTAFPRAIRKGLWQGEATLRARGGPERTVVQTLLAHRGADGRVATVTVMLQDISAQKALQRQLAADESRTRAIIDALAEGVVVQDAAGNNIAWNGSAERILGVTGDQLAGRSSLHPEWRSLDARGAPLAGDAHPISRARLHGESIDGEVMSVDRGDGDRVWLSVNARPMQATADPSAPAALATFSDITQARSVAREIETLSVVARQSDHAIVTTDSSGLLTWVNPSWERLTGLSSAEAIGRRPGAMLQGTHTSTETVTLMRDAMRNARSWNGELLNYRRDGTPFWIEMSITPTLDADGTLTGFVGLSRDITARRSLDRERQQLAAAVAVTADGIAITGVSGALEFVNHSFARMHGHKPADLLQLSWSTLYEHAEVKRLLRDAIPEVTSVGFWQGEATGRRTDGSVYPQELSLTLLPHGGLVAVTRDITERKLAEEKLLNMSLRDELTSLYNRRGFLEQAEAALKLAARQGTPCALLYGDLDAFKSVNDGFGHDAGDSALRAIAHILSTSFRETDLIARLGGDEFTVLAIDIRPEDVSIIVARVDDAIARSNECRSVDPAQAWRLGISLGVAVFDPATPLDVEVLLRRADEAQYEVKRQRKAGMLALSAPAAHV